jgi:hypothetical protein
MSPLSDDDDDDASMHTLTNPWDPEEEAKRGGRAGGLDAGDYDDDDDDLDMSGFIERMPPTHSSTPKLGSRATTPSPAKASTTAPERTAARPGKGRVWGNAMPARRVADADSDSEMEQL